MTSNRKCAVLLILCHLLLFCLRHGRDKRAAAMRSEVTCTAELQRACTSLIAFLLTELTCVTQGPSHFHYHVIIHTNTQIHVLPPEQRGTRSGQPSGPGHSCLLLLGDYLVRSGTSHSSGRPTTPGRRAQPRPTGLPPSLPSFPPAPARHPHSPVLPLRRPSSPLLSRLEMERVTAAPQLALLAPSPWPRGF